MTALMQVAAFVRRDWVTARSYRAGFGLQLVGLVFALTSFYFLGRLVDGTGGGTARARLGGSYFSFVVIGMSLLAILQVSVVSFAQKLRQEQVTGTLEALMACPAPASLVILASAVYDLIWASVLGISYIVVAIPLFGLRLHLDAGSAAATLVALPACLAVFAAVGIAVAAFTVAFKQGSSLITLVTSGISLLGGVYFPVALLPAPLEAIARALPFTWGLDALRAALLRGDVRVGRIAALVGFAVLFLPLALWIFGRALRYARREGSLAQY